MALYQARGEGAGKYVTNDILRQVELGDSYLCRMSHSFHQELSNRVND